MSVNFSITKLADQAAANLEAALAIASNGLRVFPVSVRIGKDAEGKRMKFVKPIADWPNAASADPDVIRAWWKEKPGYIPGVPCGAEAGLTVIDLDTKGDIDGVAEYRALGLVPTADLVVRTGGGGLHLYHAHAPDVGTSANKIAPGVDVRSHGGFVFAPGAVMPDGTAYTIEKGDLDELTFLSLRKVPEAIRSLAARPDREPAQRTVDLGLSDLSKTAAALYCIPADRAEDYWWRILAAVHDATGGSKAGLDLACAWSAQDPRFDRSEVAAKWRSYGKQVPGDRITAGTLWKEARKYGWQEFGFESFFDRAEEDGEEAGPPKLGKHRLSFLSPSQCADLPAREYLVKGLVAPGQIGCVFGNPGAGKSVIAPYLAYRLAQGETVFGLHTKRGPVFYVACEDEAGMGDRVKALHADLGDADGFRLVTGCSDLFSPGLIEGRGSAHLEELRAAVERDLPVLVVIDTLAMAMPGMEENDAAAMNRVVQIGKVLARYGAAVIFIHHGTKADGGTPRGHSVLNGALDFSVQVKTGDQGIVRGLIRKNRNGPATLDITFRIGSRLVGVDVDGDAITAPICEPCDPVDLEAKGTRLSGAQRAALSLMVEMAGDTGRVAEAEWKEIAMEDRAISAADSRPGRRKGAIRALQALTQAGRISVADGVITLSTFTKAAESFDDRFDDESDDLVD